MARCTCGGGDCNCSVVAGTNTTVTGSGSSANPFVVSAVTNCAEVRTCISEGPGIDYNPATGVISADISETAGNNLIIDGGGLYVPTGAATVTAGCGLTGNGAAATPIRANTGTWPYPCDLDTLASGVYCDGDGLLRGEPPIRQAFFSAGMNTLFPTEQPVPTVSDVNVAPVSVDITNPDTCRPAIIMMWTDCDVEFNLPGGGGAAMAGIDGDDLVYLANRGTGTIFSTHVQGTKLQPQAVMTPGETRTVTMNVSMGRGAGGATYVRIQATLRIWVFSIP